MPKFLLDLLTQAKAIWARLDGGQRMTIATVLLATAVGLGAIIWYAGQPSYVRLMAAESPEQFDEAMALLESGFEPRNQGMVIEVPSHLRTQARAELRKKGVLNAKEEASLLTTGMPSARERAWGLWEKQKARAEAKIRGLPAVRDVSISASEPGGQRTVRARSLHVPRGATVSLHLAQSSDFPIAARQALQMAANELRIQKFNVEVFDAKSGRRFAVDENGVGAGSSSDFASLQEEQRRLKVAQAMEALAIFGPGQVGITVNLELDPNMNFKREKIMPASGPTTQEKTTKTSEQQDRLVKGDPNEQSSVNGGPAGARTATPISKTNDTTTTKKYDPAAIGEQVSSMASPEIRRITAAVVIDEGVLTDASDQAERSRMTQTVRKLVSDAIGLDTENRPDSVTVEFLKFTEVPEIVPESSVDLMAMIEEFGPIVGNVLAVLLVIMFLKGLLKKVETKPAPVEEDPLGLIEEEEENLAPEEVARRMRREIEKAINEDPASISRMLENWLTEQKA